MLFTFALRLESSVNMFDALGSTLRE